MTIERTRVARTPHGRSRVIRALAVTMMVGSLAVLTGCGDRPWKGPQEDLIDEAVASVDFSAVGGLDCDYKRPGNNISGDSATRILGVAGAGNGQAVVDAIVAAGFIADEHADLSTGVGLSNESGSLTLSVSVVPEGNKRYGFGYCTSPPEGAVGITVY